MIEIEEAFQLNFHDVEGNMDGATSVALVERHGEVTIFDILRRLDCTFSNRWANVPEQASQFAGTGLASYRRIEEGSLVISIDVGCHCAHDCCGHLCGLDYEIQLTDRHYVVIRSTRYNY